MFTHRTARFRLAKVLGLVHIYLTCVSLTPADAGQHSVKLADHFGSSRRSPSLSFEINQGNHHDARLVGARSFSHRKSHHPGVENAENYVPRGLPESFHRHVHYRRSGIKESQHGNKNMTINVNSANDTNIVYKDEIPSSDINDIDEEVMNVSNTVKLEAKLCGSHKFGVNLMIVFGQILKAPNNRLTVDQFTSLNLILQSLIQKQVYIFSLLPILKRLQGANKETQFKLVLQALAENVPIYVVCSCTFWLREIEDGNVNIDELTSSLKQPHDFLTGIDTKVIEICKVKVAAEEMEPFDEPSKITKKTLGPVYVKIFNKLKNSELILSQKLFGVILINLPVGRLDPALEEYINYIWEVVQGNLLPNWNEVAHEIQYGNPYQLVNAVAKLLLSKGNMSDVLKHAFKYVFIHLKEVPSTFADEYNQDMQILLQDKKDVKQIFSIIQDDFAIPELSELKEKTIAYITQMNIDEILQAMNVYAYQKPIDLLIALLVRLESQTYGEDIGNTITKLLSTIISKKEFGSFTVTVSADVDLIMLLGFLNVPNSDPAIPALAQKIQLYLEENLDLLFNLQNLVPKEDKSKCQRPVQCLLYVLTKTVDPDTVEKLKVPSGLIEMIQSLIDLIEEAINSAATCEPHDILSVGNPEILDNSRDVIWEPKPPAEKATLLPIPLLISNDYDEIVFEPDDPRPQPIVVLEPGPPPAPILNPTSKPPISSSEKPVDSTTPSILPTKHPSDAAVQVEDIPILPPNLSYDRPIYVVFSQNYRFPYTSVTKPSGEPGSEAYVEFPSIQQLLQELDSDTLLSPNELPDMPEIIDLLKKILGPYFIEVLLGEHVDKKAYPTAISLMDDVLGHALEHPTVVENPRLVSQIKMYLKAIEYISITALFPVVVDSQKIFSDTIYVTFDPDNPNANSVDDVPPEKVSAGFLTMKISNPKYWVKLADDMVPYEWFLPVLVGGGSDPIQKLKDDGLFEDVIGPEFKPYTYPNIGTALTILLQKLVESKRVQSDLVLWKELNAYMKGIKAVALHNKIPKDYDTHILEVLEHNKVNWRPLVVDLELALPPRTNYHEFEMYNLIKAFLYTPDLPQLLKIEGLPYYTTRGEFLKIIFEAAICGENMVLDLKTLAALIYYKPKIWMYGEGNMPIMWDWVQTFVIREEVPLGEIIEVVIDYDSLPHELRKSYNSLMTYLSENSQFLQGDDSFPFERYPTEGTFLSGLFTHFLTKPDMSPTAKEYIRQLIPHIKLTGPGAEEMIHVGIDDITDGNIDKDGLTVSLNG